jgi:hypothetical protein
MRKDGIETGVARKPRDKGTPSWRALSQGASLSAALAVPGVEVA